MDTARRLSPLLLTLLISCADTGEPRPPKKVEERPRQTAFSPAAATVVAPVPVLAPAATPTPPPPIRRPEFPLERQDQFYDPTAPGFAQLQKANEALVDFPLDRRGFVDWTRTLAEGRIRPRAGLDADRKETVLDLDVVMRNTAQMPYVRFPHRGHTEWLACASCHPAPFDLEHRGRPIRMEEIFRGEYCGMCHDRVAFISWYACERCHNTPREPLPAAPATLRAPTGQSR